MKAKEFLRLLLPPICYRIKDKFKHGYSLSYEKPSKDKLMYECIRAINERAELSLTDIAGLTDEVPYGGMQFLTVGEWEPSYYGSFYELQNYAKIRVHNFPPKKLNIQHGILCEMFDFEKKTLENINWVWSPKVLHMYGEHTDNPHIYPIGAPFFYAKSILSKEEIQKEKKRLGRNLLAFPTHSVYYADVKYDATGFINLLKEEQKKFDTVRICIYWRDYQRGLAKVYQDAGFECVCCGHLLEPFFLERQKALFEIADATISNAVGSYLGYSIYMNKPHWMVPDKFELKDLDNRGTGKKEVEIWDSSPNYQRLREAFMNNPDYKITQEQRDIVDEYWGVSCIKTPEEIRQLINEAYNLSDKL